MADTGGRTFGETIGEVLGYLRGWLTSLRLSRTAMISSHGPTTIIKKNGRIEVGARTRLWPRVKLVALGSADTPAELTIGHHSSVGDYTQIHAGQKVSIGSFVLIAWNVNILGHYYHAPGGGEDTPGEITIEDHVWIGCNVIILKGVTIGRGAIIAAGSVVASDVPPYKLAAGNPARIVKDTKSWNGQ